MDAVDEQRELEVRRSLALDSGSTTEIVVEVEVLLVVVIDMANGRLRIERQETLAGC